MTAALHVAYEIRTGAAQMQFANKADAIVLARYVELLASCVIIALENMPGAVQATEVNR